jgi:hypothetical protein
MAPDKTAPDGSDSLLVTAQEAEDGRFGTTKLFRVPWGTCFLSPQRRRRVPRRGPARFKSGERFYFQTRVQWTSSRIAVSEAVTQAVASGPPVIGIMVCPSF